MGIILTGKTIISGGGTSMGIDVPITTSTPTFTQVTPTYTESAGVLLDATSTMFATVYNMA